MTTNTWITKQINRFLLVFIILLVVANCSFIEKPFKLNNIAEYAELLFKRQNLLTQRVMMLFDEELAPADEKRVSDAESQMHDACFLLVEYAIREMEGGKMSVFFRRRVKNSFEFCDDRVRKLESILNQLDRYWLELSLGNTQ